MSFRVEVLRLGAHRTAELTYVAVSPAGKSLRVKNGAFSPLAIMGEKVLMPARLLPALQIRRRTPLPRRTLLVPAPPPALVLVVPKPAALALCLSPTVFFHSDAVSVPFQSAANEHIERRTPDRFAFLEVAEPASTTTSNILRTGTRLECARLRARQLLLE